MPSDYKISPVTDDQEWDSFASTSLGATPFSSTKWMKIIEQITGAQRVQLGLYKNSTLCAGLAAIVQKKGPFTQLGTPELCPHTGILLGRSPEGKRPTKREADWQNVCNHFIDYLSNHYDHVRITHTPNLTDLRPFSWAGWKLNLRYTYHLEIKNRTESDLWDRVERRTRTAIRKAEKLGYTFQEIGDVDLLVNQYGKIYQDRPVPINSNLVQNYVKSIYEAGLIRIFSVQASNGETAATVAFVENDDESYAWVAGADPSHYNSGAASLLYWRYLSQCSQNRFDFVGANLPSIAFFKRGLGGNLVPYYSTEHFCNRLLRKMDRVRGLFARK
mgnify:CR=1 FL=1